MTPTKLIFAVFLLLIASLSLLPLSNAVWVTPAGSYVNILKVST